MSEALVERYYGDVEYHLKAMDLWTETIRKFPPKAIRSAVKRILERFVKAGVDPEYFDWGTEFEKLVDFEKIADFISELEDAGKIPRDVEREALERELSELEKRAAELGMRLVTEKEHSKLVRLESQIEKLKEQLRKVREERKKLEERRERLLREYAEKKRPELEARVRMEVEKKDGKYFVYMMYKDFDVPIVGWEFDKFRDVISLLESGEEYVDLYYDFMRQFADEEIVREELAKYPYPFNSGKPVRAYWTAEDVVMSPEVKEDYTIYSKTYSRSELEGLTVEDLKRICRVKGLSTEGRKEDLINRILGVTPPAPPEKPPEKVPLPPPPAEKGLTKADETKLRNQFFAILSRRGVRITSGIRAEFNHELDLVREEVKDLPREEAWRHAKRRIDELAYRIVEREEARRKPPAPKVPRVTPALPPGVVPVTGRPWGVWAPVLLGGPTREEVRRYAEDMKPLSPDEVSLFLNWLRATGISPETYEALPEGVKSKLRAEFRRAKRGE